MFKVSGSVALRENPYRMSSARDWLFEFHDSGSLISVIENRQLNVATTFPSGAFRQPSIRCDAASTAGM